MFYFTFGCGQKYENHYVIIHIPDWMLARRVMIKEYGKEWCGQYNQEEWEKPDNLCSHYKKLNEFHYW